MFLALFSRHRLEVIKSVPFTLGVLEVVGFGPDHMSTDFSCVVVVVSDLGCAVCQREDQI